MLSDVRILLLEATLYRSAVHGTLGLGGGVRWLHEYLGTYSTAPVYVSDPNSSIDDTGDLQRLSLPERQIAYRRVFECVGDASRA